MENKRQFKGIWMPAEIWEAPNLTPLDKIILMEVDSLDDGEHGCFASNKYIADFAQCSQSKVNESINKLKAMGYLEVENAQSASRIIRSNLTKNSKSLDRICQVTYQNLASSNNDDNEKEDKKRLYDDVVTMYHEECQKLPKVKKLGEARKRAIRKLATEFSMEDIREGFRKANASAFLTGGGGRGWRADFDFLIRVDKMTRIIEGGYSDFKPSEGKKDTSSFDTNEFFKAAVKRK